MKKITFFIILLFLAIFLLISLLIGGFVFSPTTSTPNQSGWVDNMWSCMGDWMSGKYPINDPFLATYGILLIVTIGFVILGIAGVVYFFFFPEINNISKSPKSADVEIIEEKSSYESVLKTLNEEEQKVLKILKRNDGKYLQKYIRHDTGLSRLKTHRILARFAERGIVTLKKSGNTNEVILAEWIN